MRIILINIATSYTFAKYRNKIMSQNHALADRLTVRPLALAVRLACAALFISNLSAPATAHAQVSSIGSANVEASGANEYKLPAVKVTAEGVSSTTEGTGSYTAGATSTATRFELSPRDTPQSVSVITRQQIEDFGHTNVNDALESTTGITVEQVETDRVYYTARGFDVTNFQVDGLGLPFLYGHSEGDTDTVIYDRIGVLRGATGLMSSMSNPSATINFVRKRPTANFQAATSATVGSWNTRRIEGDISGALTKQGNIRGRLVAAYQDKESYLDRYAHEKGVLYGVIEADITNSTILTSGHHRQNNNADHPLWGALPLYDTSGNPTNYDVSTSTAADWSYWDGNKKSTFVELSHYFDNGWQGKAVLTENKTTENSKLFHVCGTPDPTTAGSDL
jgi:outer membrane receptor for ferric coprogen and ferric-rhodotorulic acid